MTTQVEHKCVLDAFRHLQMENFEVTYLPVDSTGLVSLDELRSAIRPDTLGVSIHTVHNELGVLQDIRAIGKICRERKVFFHTDAAQAFGKVDLDVNRDFVDLMSVSGHKIYGPKGIGCLFVRRRPRVKLAPLINGGGQERGLRSGTLPTHLCVGRRVPKPRTGRRRGAGFLRNGNGPPAHFTPEKPFRARARANPATAFERTPLAELPRHRELLLRVH